MKIDDSEPQLFRSTGSYEPDHKKSERSQRKKGFDPQALTSLTGAMPLGEVQRQCFDPQALTSLTKNEKYTRFPVGGFDPQALTSLTHGYITTVYADSAVSIHRLLRA